MDHVADVAVQSLRRQRQQVPSFRRIGRMQRLPCWVPWGPGSSSTAPFQTPLPPAQVCCILLPNGVSFPFQYVAGSGGAACLWHCNMPIEHTGCRKLPHTDVPCVVHCLSQRCPFQTPQAQQGAQYLLHLGGLERTALGSSIVADSGKGARAARLSPLALPLDPGHPGAAPRLPQKETEQAAAAPKEDWSTACFSSFKDSSCHYSLPLSGWQLPPGGEGAPQALSNFLRSITF